MASCSLTPQEPTESQIPSIRLTSILDFLRLDRIVQQNVMTTPWPTGILKCTILSTCRLSSRRTMRWIAKIERLVFRTTLCNVFKKAEEGKATNANGCKTRNSTKNSTLRRGSNSRTKNKNPPHLWIEPRRHNRRPGRRVLVPLSAFPEFNPKV